MKFSQLYAPTLREVPAEAEVASHRLMLRAGMIRKASAGFYTYLPLAWRVLKKIEQIVREEMDRAGGQELLMPIVQPAEIWQQSGRWDVYGEEMFRLQDRHERYFCLGPTHEEMITTLVHMDVRSYRQLPLLLYQIQNKFRDEIRPRFGLMRGREFIMKDLYSFDRDEAGLDDSYQKMYDAYSRVFNRCGLQCRPVEADSGAIGGSGSHEFMAIAASGEAGIVYCDACRYAANVEKAPLVAIAAPTEKEESLVVATTPGAKSIAAVANFLHVPAARLIKTLAYQTDQGLVLALVRGDHEVNEVKLQNVLGCLGLRLADEAAVRSLGSVPGFLGPVHSHGARIIADATVMQMHNAVCGANERDKHYLNVNPQRDFTADVVADIRLIQAGDPCPHCGAPVKAARGIEVGQVFKLYTKYSEILHATFIDEDGQEKPLVMGCYGIGISRTMAAAIEQHHDEQGIIWPAAIAPYQVVVVPVSDQNEDQMALAARVYRELLAAGVDVVWDDRAERAGSKFKDADLIGYPLRITIGPKAVQERCVEIKERASGHSAFWPLDTYVTQVRHYLQEH